MEPLESPASLMSPCQIWVSSGPHLDPIKPLAGRGGEAWNSLTQSTQGWKQRCDTWVSPPHLRSHFIFHLSLSRWAQTNRLLQTFGRHILKLEGVCVWYKSIMWEFGLWDGTCFDSALVFFVSNGMRLQISELRPGPIVWHQHISMLTNSTASLS